MTHLHASKQAYVAIADHRDSHGRFDAGDIVIVDEPALVDLLVREGSIDPSVVVDASLFTPGTEAAAASPAPKNKGGRPRKTAAEGRNRMVTDSAVRDGPLPAVSLETDEEDDGLDEGEVSGGAPRP